jgi:hypothetical protein
MANRKISDLTALTAPATGDLLPIVDISEAAAADKNKKITYGELLASAPAGSAAAPSFSFDGDPNSGLYSAGADQVAISTNGAGRLFVDASGRIGVGTSSPGADLEIGAVSGSNRTVNIRSAGGLRGVLATDAVNGEFRIGATNDSNSGNLVFQTGAALAERMKIDSNGTTTLTSAASTSPFIVKVSTSEVARIDSSGRLGVGTSAPSEKLDILNGSISVGSSTNTNTTNTLIAGYGYILSGTKYGNTSIRSTYANSNGSASLEFYVGASGTNTAERVRIDSSGRLLVGTSTARSNVLFNATSTTPSVQIETATNSWNNGLSIINNSSGTYSATLRLGTTGGNTIGSNTLSSGGEIGKISFHGADGTSLLEAARIGAFVDGTPGANDMPGRLVFSTTADGAASPTERLRIDSSGRVGVGTSSPAELLHVSGGNIRFGSTGFIGENASTSPAPIRFGANPGATFSVPRDLEFYANIGANPSTVRMILKGQTGNVGIGTTSPQYKLVVSNNEAEGIEFRPGSASNVTQTLYYNRTSSVYTQNLSVANTHVFAINSAVTGAAVTIDSSKRLLVGTSSDLSGNDADVKLQVLSSGGPTIQFARDSNNTVSGNLLGAIAGSTTDGGASQRACQISFRADGDQASNDHPGRIEFSTTADGASSPTERMRITSAGNVGIGTTPGEVLDVNPGSSGGVIRITNTVNTNTVKFRASNSSSSLDLGSDGTGGYLEQVGAFPLRFFVNGSEAARFDSSKRLLVGTSSTSQAARAIFQGNSSSDVGVIRLALNGNSPASGDTIGSFVFANNLHENLGDIFFARDGGTWTAGSSYPTRLVFRTTADGASSPTERMRIGANGTVFIGQTTNPSTATLVLKVPTGSGNGVNAQITSNTGTSFPWSNYNASSTYVGGISCTSTATSFPTSSDYRLKTNVQPLADAISLVSQLKPSTFEFNENLGETVQGFIAHELQEVVPLAVIGEKDAEDANGNPIYQGVDAAKLVPLLTAALQEAVAEIKALKDRVTALESA